MYRYPSVATYISDLLGMFLAAPPKNNTRRPSVCTSSGFPMAWLFCGHDAPHYRDEPYLYDCFECTFSFCSINCLFDDSSSSLSAFHFCPSERNMI
jgi:hypothetical protein